jgi:16S rRNA (cytosine1407-C5)-methyltransferase
MLDKASVLAALSLRLPQKGLILDACAAPGGKSLVIASRMSNETELLCNELSAERRRRLVNALDEHLDAEARSKVKVSGFDTAAQGGRKSEHGRFSAILLDAPCSSERHVINDENALAKWTSARPRSLAQRQWALLSSCFLMLEPGGALVYSTCALSAEENDEVMARLFEKYKGIALPGEPDFSEGEKTEYGRLILPDKDGSMGPMYVARAEKKS